MKKYVNRVTVGFLVLAIGIAVIWSSGVYQIVFPSRSNPLSTETATIRNPIQQSARGRSGKVGINFRDFEYGKEWNANFEIINETTQPIYYVGSKRKDKFDYCTLGVRHEEPFPANPDGKIENLTFRVTDACYHGTFMALQILNPGESIVLAAGDYRVRDMLAIKDSKKETTAQIGFEVFVGEEKRREILWSEEITFPADQYRQ